MASAIIATLLHALIALSTFYSAIAFFSGDPSGIQYVAVYYGWGVACVAAVVALIAFAFSRLDDVAGTAWLIVMAIFYPVLAFAGAGFAANGSLDPAGQVLSVAVAVAQAAVIVMHVRRGRNGAYARRKP